jgi:GNAT superfamily N-acetyltransferase
MTIQKYEDWMRPQVVALFDIEYHSGEAFDSLFKSFYEHPFQVQKCIRIVALEGERVAGFQSFFYWPVVVDGRAINAYQSGNSLVHPDFRGKGLFGKMLNFIHEPNSGFDCELLIGFPVEASYNSFIRNKWQNPFNLRWYVKPLNPLRSLLTNPVKNLRKALGERVKMDFLAHPAHRCVAQLAAFDHYRFEYETGDFFRFTFEKEGAKAFFELKAQTRKKVIKELVIGKFLSNSDDAVFIHEAVAALIKTVKKNSGFTMLSIAVNPLTLALNDALKQNGFKAINKSIYFITKGRLAEQTTDWSNWWIFRSDIDTW